MGYRSKDDTSLLHNDRLGISRFSRWQCSSTKSSTFSENLLSLTFNFLESAWFQSKNFIQIYSPILPFTSLRLGPITWFSIQFKWHPIGFKLIQNWMNISALKYTRKWLWNNNNNNNNILTCLESISHIQRKYQMNYVWKLSTEINEQNVDSFA